MTRTAKPIPMCVVEVGYQTFLLPSSEGMKLVQLMQNAFAVEATYEDQSYSYFVKEQPEVELKLVKPSQIRKRFESTAEPVRRLS